MLKILKIRLAILLALAGVLNVAGCGQTGPLYLPQKLAQAPDLRTPLIPKPVSDPSRAF